MATQNTGARCGKCGYEVKPRCGCFNLERECVDPQAERTCDCRLWASTDLSYLQGKREHHPNCDGHGGHRNGVMKESEMSVEAFKPDTPLSLLEKQERMHSIYGIIRQLEREIEALAQV